MKIEKKRMLAVLCIVQVMVSFTGNLGALSCPPGMACDRMASQYGGTLCPVGSTGPCNLLISDAFVNCVEAWATCGNTGATINNVITLNYVGNCDGAGACAGAVISSTVSSRCEKTTGAPCYLAKDGDAKLYSKR